MSMIEFGVQRKWGALGPSWGLTSTGDGGQDLQEPSLPCCLRRPQALHTAMGHAVLSKVTPCLSCPSFGNRTHGSRQLGRWSSKD